ncbi:MAG: DNA repair protein RadA [Bacteriovoracales bacterium]|nr:DNA repair protein RadA [Bacteriovoracales bacterium]
MKNKSQFVCSSCAHVEPKWVGRCSQCGEWNSFQEEVIDRKKRPTRDSNGPKPIGEISQSAYERVATGIGEFDRVVGSGLVRGSLLLVGGGPGIGKSTLIMEVCGKLGHIAPSEKILYVSGEESEGQVADRSKRLGIDSENFFVLNETNWEKIRETLKSLRPSYFVLDSIQTTSSDHLQSTPGTVSQVREVTYEILNYCKAHSITSVIIGHITKDGQIAGPKVLEHMVDAVVYFEGDPLGHYRILRSIKNRFGNTNEVGIFEMTELGLREVADPSKYFLDLLSKDSYGRSISCIVEGSRPLFIETQALVIENKNGFGRRTAQGIDSGQLAMLVAVAEKYFDTPLSFSDIYANIVGGIRLKTREADLAVLAAILSSLRKIPIPDDTILLGEVGLTGEVRSVPMPQMRIKEMERLQYKRLISSKRMAKEFQDLVDFPIVGIEKAHEIDELLFR